MDAGFDAVIFDGAQLSLEENIKQAKLCVAYAKKANPNILIEGELGYIGTSSKLLDAIPQGVVTSGEGLTTPVRLRFVRKPALIFSLRLSAISTV